MKKLRLKPERQITGKSHGITDFSLLMWHKLAGTTYLRGIERRTFVNMRVIGIAFGLLLLSCALALAVLGTSWTHQQ